jgi:hypothetical protein
MELAIFLGRLAMRLGGVCIRMSAGIALILFVVCKMSAGLTQQMADVCIYSKDLQYNDVYH